MGNKKIFYKIVGIISIIIYGLFFVFINKYKLFPVKYRILLILVGLFILIIYLYLSFRKKTTPKLLINIFLAIMLITNIVTLLVTSYAYKSISTVKMMNYKEDIIKTQISFVVQNDSPIEYLNEIENKKIAVIKTLDASTKNKLLKKIEDNNEVIYFDDYISACNSLLDDNVQVMLLNESFRSVVDENIDNFSKNTRVIDSFLLENKDENKEYKKVSEYDSFNIYLSGIDTYGSLSNVSRSDVNIIVSVNPSKGKILITSIPRDTYVDIYNVGYDKLTHAGLFGVNTSIKTLENLLDIDIDYYGKVNFTSLKELVDTLSGIRVNNPRAFKSSLDDYTFEQGDIYLDGDKALAFARERYNLEEGDFDRGKNHIRIIEGVIKKMISPQSLLKFNSIADTLLKLVNTDIPYEKMIELVNIQLDDNIKREIDSQSLDGKGSYGYKSYLMPNMNLYMMIPYDKSIDRVSNSIKNNNK